MKIPVDKQLNVLVCPMDWGLGHASRMIPVIRGFKNHHIVIMGGTGRSGELLRNSFPDLAFLSLPSPVIKIGGGRNPIFHLMTQIPGLILSVFREHYRVKNLVRLYEIDLIISDNRYGLFCRNAYSIFITHQISPVLPRFFRWLEYPVYRIIRQIIGYFDECWIPDDPDPENNISGKLSHRFKLPLNARFIGLLSRFAENEIKARLVKDPHYNIVAVLSGPEPQISDFEKLLYRQLQDRPETILMISGLRENFSGIQMEKIKYMRVSHLPEDRFAGELRQADYVICRSGYSAIMDLVILGIHAILVPTPGQSEQEYLGAWLSQKGWFQVIPQKNLDLPGLLDSKIKKELKAQKPLMIAKSQKYFPYLDGKYRGGDEKSQDET